MTIPQKKTWLILLLAGALILPAQTAFASDAADAAKFYEQASEAYQAEDYARADELLARAYAKDPDLIYQYNRVLANQAQGNFKAALDILDTYQAQMAADPEARFTDIPQIRENLESKQAKAEAEANASTGSDETNAAQTAPANMDLSVSPQGDVAAVDDDSGSQILGWTLVGVGVAGLGSAALFGSKVLIPDVADRFDCVNDGGSDCYQGFGDEAGRDQQFEDDKSAWDTQKTLTWVSLGVGAAALVGGGVVLYLDAQDDGDDGPGVSASATKLEWTPYVTTDGVGGTFNLSF